MARFFFIITLLVSFNVHAAKYILCSRSNDDISFKIDSNNIYVLKSDEYENITENVKIWNEEIIKISFKISYSDKVSVPPTQQQRIESRECSKKADKIKNKDIREIEIVNCYAKLLNYEEVTKTANQIFLIDRVKGELKNTYRNKSRTYKCELRKKTLF